MRRTGAAVLNATSTDKLRFYGGDYLQAYLHGATAHVRVEAGGDGGSLRSTLSRGCIDMSVWGHEQIEQLLGRKDACWCCRLLTSLGPHSHHRASCAFRAPMGQPVEVRGMVHHQKYQDPY